MTGQNKIGQERPADDELILFGSCDTVDTAHEFIDLKMFNGGWRVLIPPFPLEFRAIGIADPSLPKVDGKTQLQTVRVASSWGFILHKFY